MYKLVLVKHFIFRFWYIEPIRLVKFAGTINLLFINNASFHCKKREREKKDLLRLGGEAGQYAISNIMITFVLNLHTYPVGLFTESNMGM